MSRRTDEPTSRRADDSAIVHCACPEIRETILRKPAIVSHGVDDGFLNRFVWDGTSDCAAALAAPVALDCWETVGVEKVRKHMQTTLQQGVSLLSKLWHDGNLETTTLAPMPHTFSPMALVRLPQIINDTPNKTSDNAKHVQDYLCSQQIEVPIKPVHGVPRAHLSCHVCNALDDYQRLGLAMLDYRPITS